MRSASAAAATVLLLAVSAPAAAAPGKWEKRIDPAAAKRAESGRTPYVPPGAGSVANHPFTPLVIDEDPGGLPYVSGELLVTYAEDASNGQIAAANDRVDAETEDRFAPIDARALELPGIKDLGSRPRRESELEAARRELESDPDVETAEYNYVQGTAATPNDPGFSQQWGLPRIRAPQAWDTALGEDTLIAVLDSGIQTSAPNVFNPNHPDIGGIVAGGDFVHGDSIPEDNNGHGTHVAGIAGADTDNGIGVAGTSPESNFVIGKVCEDSGGGLGGPASCPLNSVINGLIATADFGGVDVINMSLGGPACPDVQRQAVDHAVSKGIVVAAAAGNDAVDTPHCPAAFPNVIAVSGTDIDNGESDFSNFGDWVDIAAPGGDSGNPQAEDILSTFPPSTYRFLQGTSMSTPFVSGVASLLAGQGRGRGEIRNRIESTAVDLPPAGKDVLFGNGLLDALAAVRSQTDACTGANANLAAAQQDLVLARSEAESAGRKAKKAQRKARKARRKAKKKDTEKAKRKARRAKRKARKAKKQAKTAIQSVSTAEGAVQSAQSQVDAAAEAKGFTC